MKDYKRIGEALENATVNSKKYKYMTGLIRVMKKNYEVLQRIACFEETAWEIIQDFINSKPQGVNEEYFFQACAWLEQEKNYD